jgi:DNA polymerase-3 subunit epsilon
MPEIVVFDVETTGFKSTDRIVEIAGVIWDSESDAIVGEFETLIDPSRNVPSEVSKIHGLRAEHLSTAPTFSELAGWLMQIFDRRPVITHNASFDLRMVNQEFERIGADFRLTQAGCTLMATGKRLSLACEDAGYSLENAHSALADARGALAVARSIGVEYFLDSMTKNIHVAPPQNPGTPRTLSRAQIGLEELDSNFRSLPRRIEFEGSPIDYYYLAFLDEVLDDMVVTDQELETLRQIAAEAGLTTEQVSELHRVYLAHLESAALRDGRITPEEMDLIEQFANLIGVQPTVTVSEGVDRTELRKDLLICSTGTAEIGGRIMSKDELAEKVMANGHDFTDSLTKKAGIGLLLVDSYGSQSGKVKNAVKWGIPIMSVSDYLNQNES